MAAANSGYIPSQTAGISSLVYDSSCV